jgi:hypothetical protein
MNGTTPGDGRTLRETIATDELAAILRESGFRAELAVDAAGRPVLHSASSGVPFHVRFGNVAAETDGRFVDFTLTVAVQLDIPVPLGFVADWNATRRFARMHGHDRLLVMEMDVLLAGGVGDPNLRANVEIWDRLLQELLMGLRRSVQEAGAGSTTS